MNLWNFGWVSVSNKYLYLYLLSLYFNHKMFLFLLWIEQRDHFSIIGYLFFKNCFAILRMFWKDLTNLQPILELFTTFQQSRQFWKNVSFINASSFLKCSQLMLNYRTEKKNPYHYYAINNFIFFSIKSNMILGLLVQ